LITVSFIYVHTQEGHIPLNESQSKDNCIVTDVRSWR